VTCRHFRRSVAAQLGYCGLDRQRRPLRGDEIRACWEASHIPVEIAAGEGAKPAYAPAGLDGARTPVRRLEFVEVRSGPPRSRERAIRGATAAPPAPSASASSGIAADAGPPDIVDRPITVSPAEPGWSLWGDTEP